jgi:hypothetical protein
VTELLQSLGAEPPHAEQRLQRVANVDTEFRQDAQSYDNAG